MRSISKQTYKNIETIIIDDNSSDHTADIALKVSKKFLVTCRTKRFSVHQERGIIRNIGAKLSKGKYLFFLDGDMELSPKVMKDSVNLIKTNSDIKAIIIREESMGIGYWAQCRILEKKCYFGDNDIEAARFFDKVVFWKVGGWDQNMISGEDWDLTRRVREKYEVGRINSPIYHHEGKLNLIKTAKKKYYYTVMAKPYLKKNPMTFQKIFHFGVRPAFFRNWRLLIADPIHAFGLFILKVVEFSAGIFGLIRLKIS